MKSDHSEKNVEVFEGSTFDRKSLQRALKGVDAAYFLIHSLGAKGDLLKMEEESATDFRDACIEAGVKRMIYLGGLGKKETASKHLLSRIQTGEILSAQPDRIQTLWFRAGIVVGSGSASFEIIRNLVQKLPVLVAPKWVHTKTQSISIRDVLEYLHLALHLEVQGNLIVDIGSEALSFKEMLLRAAKVMGLRRKIVTVALLTPRISSCWLLFLTPVPYRIARSLTNF